VPDDLSRRDANGLAPCGKAVELRRTEPLQAFIERFVGALTTDRIAEQHRDKIDHLVMSEAATGKMYLLFKSSKHALAFEVVGDQSHLSKPGGR